MQHPNRQPRRGIHPALIIVGILAVIPILFIAIFFAGLSAMGGNDADSGAGGIVLEGAVLVGVCVVVIHGGIQQRRKPVDLTPLSLSLDTGTDMPPPPPHAAAPAAPRSTLARLLGVAAGALAAVIVLPLAFLGLIFGLGVVSALTGVPFELLAGVGIVALIVVGIRRLTARRHQPNAD